MAWDQRYRRLEEGEIVQDGDEVLGPDDGDKWEPAKHTIGRPAPIPSAPAHCWYRRLK